MNPLAVGLVLGAVTTLARWARGKQASVDTVVGVVGVALGLAVIEQANKDFAKALGTLAVVGVSIVHLGDLLEAVRKATEGPPKQPGGPLPKG